MSCHESTRRLLSRNSKHLTSSLNIQESSRKNSCQAAEEPTSCLLSRDLGRSSCQVAARHPSMNALLKVARNHPRGLSGEPRPTFLRGSRVRCSYFRRSSCPAADFFLLERRGSSASNTSIIPRAEPSAGLLHQTSRGLSAEIIDERLRQARADPPSYPRRDPAADPSAGVHV